MVRLQKEKILKEKKDELVQRQAEKWETFQLNKKLENDPKLKRHNLKCLLDSSLSCKVPKELQ